MIMLVPRKEEYLEAVVALSMVTSSACVADNQHCPTLAAAGGVGRHR